MQAQWCRACASVASGLHQPELRAGDGRRDRDHRNATPLSGIHFTPTLKLHLNTNTTCQAIAELVIPDFSEFQTDVRALLH
jgi:hypothetical protein